MAKTKEAKAVDAIISDLSDRRGLGNEWDMIDDEIKDEIRKAWAKLIVRAMGGK